MTDRLVRIGLLLGSTFVACVLLIALIVVPLRVAQPSATAFAAQTSTITLTEAIERAQRFVGDPRMPIRGGLEPLPDDLLDQPVYWLESGSGELVDEFKVDARTGEVLEAVFRSRLTSATGERAATIEEAAVIAAEFASSRYQGFESLTLLERSEVPARAVGTMYTLKWIRVEPTSKAELPTSVSVSVASSNRRVIWYLAQRDPVRVSITPRVSAEAARTTIQAAISGTAELNGARAATPRLQVIYDDYNRQRLAWTFLVTAPRAQAAPERVLLMVDAHSGEIIETHG